jgi:lysozyme
MEVDGVDVSHHQGTIDWKKVAAGGKRFAIIRCSFGTVEDEMFELYRRGASKNGLAVAAYCFGRSDQDAKDQADAALEIAGDVGIFLDIEPWKASSGKIVPKISVAQAEAFAKRVDKKGRFLGTYTSSGVFGTDASQLLAKFPLWVAHYHVQKPRLPRNWGRFAIWQHSSEGPGKALGAESKFMDLNRYQGTVKTLKQWFTGQVDKANQSDDVDDTAGGALVEEPREEDDAAPAWPGYFLQAPSPHVRRWQVRMRRLGFQVKTDGVYGGDSERACRKFQRRQGLEVDGVVGPKTWEAAFEEEP